MYFTDVHLLIFYVMSVFLVHFNLFHNSSVFYICLFDVKLQRRSQHVRGLVDGMSKCTFNTCVLVDIIH